MASFAGFWGDSPNDYSLLTDKSSLEKKLRQLFRRPQMRKNRAIFKALNGAAAGGAVSSTFKQIDDSGISHPIAVGSLGGARTVATTTVISSTTTSAQETAIDNILDGDFAPTYPADLSGNGGGAY